MKVRSSKKGFTIIEVVVVLAIAGLIFGVVFWALPNLQKSSRDSARKSTVSNISSALSTYASNNNNSLPAGTPAGFRAFLTAYFPVADGGVSDASGTEFSDAGACPDTSCLVGSSGTQAWVAATPPKLGYFLNAECNGTTGTTAASGSRDYAVIIELEQGATFCTDNN